jgi:hypothetical protein
LIGGLRILPAIVVWLVICMMPGLEASAQLAIRRRSVADRQRFGSAQQACDDCQIGTPTGPLPNPDVPWNPKQLASVGGAVNREFDEAIEDASPGYWRTLVTGEDHAIYSKSGFHDESRRLSEEFGVPSTGKEDALTAAFCRCGPARPGTWMLTATLMVTPC